MIARVLSALILVLVLAASSSAECAWVLWNDTKTSGSGQT